MPTKCFVLSPEASTGAYTQLANIDGRCRVLYHGNGNEVRFVTDVESPAEALASNTANRFNCMGTVSAPLELHLNPAKTYIRSNGVAFTGYAMITW